MCHGRRRRRVGGLSPILEGARGPKGGQGTPPGDDRPGVRCTAALLFTVGAILAGCGVLEPSGDPVQAGTDRGSYAPGQTLALTVVNLAEGNIYVSPGLCGTSLQVENPEVPGGWENASGGLALSPGPRCGVGMHRDIPKRFNSISREFQIQPDA